MAIGYRPSDQLIQIAPLAISTRASEADVSYRSRQAVGFRESSCCRTTAGSKQTMFGTYRNLRLLTELFDANWLAVRDKGAIPIRTEAIIIRLDDRRPREAQSDKAKQSDDE